ncbi:hypothetical protein AS850_06510 [Frondihabitans sp. 762G35]|uniref:hypothetical protein n=1 Tax=Frondihabitans sp. 762G35 TaxID=1446794 RepID=UPI000D2265FE|nr:hypothetical protein [Frondihabitans sp. 762G35]ARC56726.1 hypothetical protein AS850_06510 [Frondihabitans sp. 762G35]
MYLHLIRRARLARGLGAIAAVGALVGCASTVDPSEATTGTAVARTATGTPTASPTPSTSPAATTPSIVLGPGHLTITGPDSTRTPGGDAARSVAELTELLGAPTVTTTGQDHCVTPGTAYDWDGALTVFAPEGGAPLETRLGAPAVASADGASVELEGPEGVQVGDDAGALLAALPDSLTESHEVGGETVTTALIGPAEATAGETPGRRGVAAVLRGTTVTAIAWPVIVHGAGDC